MIPSGTRPAISPVDRRISTSPRASAAWREAAEVQVALGEAVPRALVPRAAAVARRRCRRRGRRTPPGRRAPGGLSARSSARHRQPDQSRGRVLRAVCARRSGARSVSPAGICAGVPAQSAGRGRREQCGAAMVGAGRRGRAAASPGRSRVAAREQGDDGDQRGDRGARRPRSGAGAGAGSPGGAGPARLRGGRRRDQLELELADEVVAHRSSSRRVRMPARPRETRLRITDCDVRACRGDLGIAAPVDDTGGDRRALVGGQRGERVGDRGLRAGDVLDPLQRRVAQHRAAACPGGAGRGPRPRRGAAPGRAAAARCRRASRRRARARGRSGGRRRARRRTSPRTGRRPAPRRRCGAGGSRAARARGGGRRARSRPGGRRARRGSPRPRAPPHRSALRSFSRT